MAGLKPDRRSALCLGAALVLALAAPRLGAADAEPVLTWGDQGDGTYRNPVLDADYSDPDLIRVGGDFYLIASDFHFVGMQVLHSTDLVNWSIIGQVFNRLSMNPRYDQMTAYSQGTWAPSLRFHAGEFYIYCCTPHEGLFMWHARNPAGPWSEAVTVKAVDGWEDPCPFWDDDGRAWLVHGRYGAGPIILHRLSADGTRLLDDGVEIYRGSVAEGPKVFRRHGWYYISLPEGGVGEGGQSILRARSIQGPYERRVALPNGSPHQGGLVELDSGESWFIGFKSSGALGRVCFLEPVRWGDDDWPVFGDRGMPVDRWRKPNTGTSCPVSRPQASDEFAGPNLGPQWQWNHNPVNPAWSLVDRPGWLRLRALPADSLALARNTLTQKLWDSRGVVDTHLDVGGMADGQHAGLAFISGKVFGWVGVAQTGGVRRIAWNDGTGAEVTSGDIWLRGTHEGETAQMWASVDRINYAACGPPFPLKWSQWKGARLGIFSYGGKGAADFDFVHYVYGGRATGAGR